MDKFISETCKNAMFYIYQLPQSIVTKHTYSPLVYHGWITQIRYWSAVSTDTARLNTNIKIYEHITPVPMELHWLPKEVSILFKPLALGCVCWTALLYLNELVTLDQNKVVQGVAPAGTQDYKCVPDKSFSVARLTYWNDLPPDLRCTPSILFLSKRLKRIYLKCFIKQNSSFLICAWL